MPVRFYVIPMEPGPYSRANMQRPMHLDGLQANWSGYPLFAWNRYLCQVNTTVANHTTLTAAVGVFAFPDVNLDVLVGNLPALARSRIQTFLANQGLAYDAGETVEALIRRVITSVDPKGIHWNPKRVYVGEH